ncbi:MAG: TIGR04282 family arsenosugar biosynthesis glycosyltransferase [Solirubrobacterales bacterium]
METQLLVIAKSPVAGSAKTRLCPPCTEEQAAALAEAALADTLEAVAATECAGRTLVLEGDPGEWLPAGFEVVPQRGDGLGERLAAAFAGRDGAALLVGMDTPQLCPELLGESIERLADPGRDAVLGPAEDGGYWAIGMRRPRPEAFLGVPMSTNRTGERQLVRLHRLGMRVAKLPTLRDVDYWPDAVAVAAAAPGSRFARAVASLEHERA